MKKYAIIVAGGAGTRMGSQLPKQFLFIKDKPVLWYTLTAFLTAYDDLQIILVLPEQYLEEGQTISAATNQSNRIQLTAGGDTRYQSVKNGLTQVKDASIVFVHDGVRCLVTVDLIHRCYDAALENGNAIPAIAATDSIRIDNGNSYTVIDRQKLRIIQTPQTFLSDQLLPAFAQAYDASFTDEATVVEKTGIAIHLVEGESSNIKITHPLDLMLAEKIIEERQ